MTFLYWVAACVAIYFFLKLFDPKKDKNEESNIVQDKRNVPYTQLFTPEEKEAMRQAKEVWDDETYNAIIQHSYQGKLPEQIVGSYYTDLYPNIYRTSIAGINFRRGIKDLAGMYFMCRIESEPKNKYDANAIKILHNDGRHLGYIPADETDAVRQFLDGKLPYLNCKAHIDEGEEDNDETGRTRHFLIGQINIYKPNTKPF